MMADVLGHEIATDGKVAHCICCPMTAGTLDLHVNGVARPGGVHVCSLQDNSAGHPSQHYYYNCSIANFGDPVYQALVFAWASADWPAADHQPSCPPAFRSYMLKAGGQLCLCS